MRCFGTVTPMAGSVWQAYRRQPLLFLVTLFALAGAAAFAVGLVYSTVAAANLPSFVPGHVAGLHRTRSTRGHGALALGALVLVVAGVMATDVKWKELRSPTRGGSPPTA